MIGRTLGPYEIVERLGAGGMGEVYRARDTTLQRDIAIKILPGEMATDPERLARFRQEARLLAGVHHANIAAVYGLEDIDGVQFFTQELVRGHTLSTRIAQQPMELDDVLSICAQMADAIETAHSHGIVHRDLKPANVMVTDDGNVKVLDFGLARPVQSQEEVQPSGESTPTISTVRPEGTVLGTAAYMSPDQARGRNVDHRGDIWAFGCVMYEMLTGRKAFDGETLLDTLSHVVRSEPDWDAIPATTPPRLTRLVKRCLRKKLRDRLQSMGDARIELTEMLAEPDFGVAVPPAAGASAPAGRGSRLGVYVVVAGIVGAAAGVAGSRILSPTTTPQTTAARLPLHLELPVPSDARLVSDIAVPLAVSPDGRRLAYVAMLGDTRRVFLQSLVDSTESVPVSGDEEANNPFFSPDGKWLGYFLQNRRLVKMPVEGGADFTVAELPVGNWGATWLPDDTIVYAPAFTGQGLLRVPAAGGESVQVTFVDEADGELGHHRPQGLPGGRHVLYTAQRSTSHRTTVLDLETGERRVVLADALDTVWVPTGHLLFSRNGQMFAIQFDLAKLETVGNPFPLLTNVFTDPKSDEAIFVFSSDGSLIYVPTGDTPIGEQLAWVGRDGSTELLGAPPGEYGHPRISPDGNLIGVDRMDAGRGDIWIWDLQRRSFTRLTNSGDNRMPVWRDNSKQVLFASNTGGSGGIYWRSADGSGERHNILVADYTLWPRSWFKDAIVYYELNPSTSRDIWAIASTPNGDDGATPVPKVQTPANERAPALSPDGRWLAYVSDESGRDEIYVQAFDDEAPIRHTISNNGGSEPVWSRDGTELFYRQGRGLYRVEVQAGGAFTAAAPELLLEGDFASDRMGTNQYFDIDGDGQRFLMILRDPTGGVPDHLHVIVNFAETLRSDAE